MYIGGLAKYWRFLDKIDFANHQSLAIYFSLIFHLIRYLCYILNCNGKEGNKGDTKTQKLTKM